MNKLLAVGIIILFIMMVIPTSGKILEKKTSMFISENNTFDSGITNSGGNSSFILLDTIYDGDYYYGVWGDGTYIYVACKYGGIRAYSFNGNKFILEGERNDGGWYADVWGDGTYIYVANYDEGLRVYSFDGNNFILLDTHYGGEEFDSYFRIWGEESNIFVVCLYGGISAYSFDGNTLTMEAHRDDGGSYQGIGGDGNYIYAGCKDSGIRAYSFNGDNFTLLDTYLGGSDYEAYYEIWCQNDYIFSSVWSEGIKTFSFDGNNFSYLSGHYYGGCYMGCWGDGFYIYTTVKYEGIMAYSFDGNQLLLEAKRDDGGWYYSVWGDGTYIYTACLDEGLRAYSFVKVLYVGGDGPGNYSKIQDAIDNASDGDTVFVFDDSSPYYENIIINKSITLEGEQKETTIIHGDCDISMDWVNVSGFTIKYSDIGIDISSNFTTIEGNILSNHIYGLYLDHCHNNTIIGNNVTNSQCGIELYYSNKNEIKYNYLNSNLDGGIYLGNSGNNVIYRNQVNDSGFSGIGLDNKCINNVIMDNIITNNIDGIVLVFLCNNNTIKDNKILTNYDIGIAIQESSNNKIIGNNVSNNFEGIRFMLSTTNQLMDNYINLNNDNGILIWHSNGNSIINTKCLNNYVGIRFSGTCNDNIISDCNFSYNDHGITLQSTGIGTMISNCSVYANNFAGLSIDFSGYHKIINNNISSNHWGVLIGIEADSNNNEIYHNNIINNSINSYDSGSNIWYNSTLEEGNYFDDYSGKDANNDRIGDTPYNISAGDNQDMYPLMYPWNEIPPVADFIYYANNRTFDASYSYDRDGEIVSWLWDFDDGTNGTGMVITHNYSESGFYDVTLNVTDNGGYDDSITKSIEVTNQQPGVPIINGPQTGKFGETYSYTFVSEDPNGDDVYYEINWGEGSVEPWDGPHDSNTVISRDHNWGEEGSFTIMARAKDVYEAIGEWGTFDITMPKNKGFVFNFPLLNWLFERFPNAFPILRYMFRL